MSITIYLYLRQILHPAPGIHGFLFQIALTSQYNLIMLKDIPFPAFSTIQSLIPPTQIFPIDYSDISVHRSHHTLFYLLFVSLLHTQHANPFQIQPQ